MDETENRTSQFLRMGGEVVWRPTEEYISGSRLNQFMSRHDISTVPELHARAIEDPEWFWKAVLDELGIEFSNRTSA